MELKYQVKSLEEVEEKYHDLYSEQEGKFSLRVQGHDKLEANENKIPKARLDAEIAKRRQAEDNLTSVAEALRSDIPEKYRDLIPELPPAQMVSWIQKMNQSGIFDSKDTNPIDNSKPNDKPPHDLEGLSPQAKMAMGYK